MDQRSAAAAVAVEPLSDSMIGKVLQEGGAA
jgi:hypothetical protein